LLASVVYEGRATSPRARFAQLDEWGCRRDERQERRGSGPDWGQRAGRRRLRRLNANSNERQASAARPESPFAWQPNGNLRPPLKPVTRRWQRPRQQGASWRKLVAARPQSQAALAASCSCSLLLAKTNQADKSTKESWRHSAPPPPPPNPRPTNPSKGQREAESEPPTKVS